MICTKQGSRLKLQGSDLLLGALNNLSHLIWPRSRELRSHRSHDLGRSFFVLQKSREAYGSLCVLSQTAHCYHVCHAQPLAYAGTLKLHHY